METFNNENDQVDALKRFFAENGKALAVGVIFRDWRAGWLALLDLPSAGYRQRRVAGLREGDFRAEIEYARSAVRGREIRG